MKKIIIEAYDRRNISDRNVAHKMKKKKQIIVKPFL